MKSIILFSVVMTLLIFSGCGDKKPGVEDQVKTELASEAGSLKTGTIVSEQSMVNSSSANSISDLEGKLGSIYFGFDEFSISSDMETEISMDATIAKESASKFNIKLEGNCDEWGSDEYNFALGLKRANAVKKALIAEGVNSSSITMASFGESNPVCKEKTQDCWAKSRRVDFTLLP